MSQKGPDTKRNMGIDLLRMVSMFMVVFLHVLLRGGVLGAVMPLTVNYGLVWGFETAAYCAVNCYGLISGYVGYRAKFRVSNIVLLWCRVVYYTLLISFVFAVLTDGLVGKQGLINAIFPVSTEQYWYFTAYVGMFFFIPLLNMFINRASKKQMTGVIAACFVLFSLFPTIFRRDIFYLYEGYSAFWLMILYLMGGYIAKYDIGKKVKSGQAAGVYIVCIIVSWVVKMGMDKRMWDAYGSLPEKDLLVSYTSPTILLAGAALVILFSRMHIPQRMKRWIGIFAPLSFSVYLIHFHPLIKEHILQDRFGSYAQHSPAVLAVLLIGTVCFIFFACLFFDLIRDFLFKKMKIKERIMKAEQKISQILMKE